MIDLYQVLLWVTNVDVIHYDIAANNVKALVSFDYYINPLTAGAAYIRVFTFY